MGPRGRGFWSPRTTPRWCLTLGILIWPLENLKCLITHMLPREGGMLKFRIDRHVTLVAAGDLWRCFDCHPETIHTTFTCGKVPNEVPRSCFVGVAWNFLQSIFLGSKPHRFRWYATLENKTLAETFPKFPSTIRVIDMSDRNPPITAC